MRSPAVYFEARPLSIALMAACLMLSGVSKSGSPAPSPITSRPACLSARALPVTAVVAGGLDALKAPVEQGHGNLVFARRGYRGKARAASRKACLFNEPC